MAAPARTRSDYERAERRGRWAEWLCCLALMLKGYRILGTRVRLPAGELDILALRRQTLAVVEVKARRSEEAALASVGQRNWERRRRAVHQYVGARPKLGGHGIRFDLMIVLPGRWPRHIEDIWRAR